jgi:hypothetical protein
MKNTARRNSYDGLIRTAPLDADAFRQTKMTQIDTENKKIQRIIENFETSSPRQR